MADVYLAARLGRRDEMLDRRGDLVLFGHEVTSQWIYGDPAGDTLSDAVNRDLRDITASDVLVMFAEPMAEYIEGGGNGGVYTELGVALGISLWSGMRTIVVGDPGNPFATFNADKDTGVIPPEFYSSWLEALSAINHGDA